MTKPSEDFNDPIRTVGPDATADFDDGPSNPTEHASSESLVSAREEDHEDAAVRSDDQVEPAEQDGNDIREEDEEDFLPLDKSEAD